MENIRHNDTNNHPIMQTSCAVRSFPSLVAGADPNPLTFAPLLFRSNIILAGLFLYLLVLLLIQFLFSSLSSIKIASIVLMVTDIIAILPVMYLLLMNPRDGKRWPLMVLFILVAHAFFCGYALMSGAQTVNGSFILSVYHGVLMAMTFLLVYVTWYSKSSLMGKDDLVNAIVSAPESLMSAVSSKAMNSLKNNPIAAKLSSMKKKAESIGSGIQNAANTVTNAAAAVQSAAQMASQVGAQAAEAVQAAQAVQDAQAAQGAQAAQEPGAIAPPPFKATA